VSSSKPTPGRCGAKLRSGGFCMRYPTKGQKRCRLHGSGTKEKPGGRPPVHGRFSARFQKLAAEGRQQLAELMDDPQLLDAKRPVALATLIVTEMDLAPTDEQIVDLACELVGDVGDPGPVEIAKAQAVYHQAALKAIDTLGKRQEAANRQAKVGDVIIAGALPIFERLGAAVAQLSNLYVPADKRERFVEDLNSRLQVTIAELAALGEK